MLFKFSEACDLFFMGLLPRMQTLGYDLMATEQAGINHVPMNPFILEDSPAISPRLTAFSEKRISKQCYRIYTNRPTLP